MFLLSGIDLSSLLSNLSGDDDSTTDASETTRSTVGKNTLIISEAPKRPIAATDNLNQSMIKLINICMNEDVEESIKELFENINLYVLFMKTVLTGVIRMRRWNMMLSVASNNYYNFITPSDEAFGIVALDNCGDRFICLALNMKDKNRLCIPKYTTVHGEKRVKDKNEKGWSKVGQMRYWKLEDKIEKWRQDNKDRLEHINREIMKSLNDVEMNEDDEEDLRREEDSLKRKIALEDEARDYCLRMFKKKIVNVAV